MKKIGYIFLIALFAIAAIMPDGATASAPDRVIPQEWVGG